MTALKLDGSAGTQPISGTLTGNQGSANTVGNAWPIKVTDGTNAVTVVSLTNSKALAVEIVDGSGSTPMPRPNAVSLDSSGNLNVNVAAGGASGGTSSSYGRFRLPVASIVAGDSGENSLVVR